MVPPSKPIQVIPQGLLGFLQLKNMGQNPEELLGSLAPVLEMRDWYFKTNRVSLVPPTAINIPNNSVSYISSGVSVPAGQYWVITNMLASATLAAAEVLAMQLATLLQPAVSTDSQTQVFPGDYPIGDLTGPNRCLRVGWNDLIWLPPGADIGIAIQRSTTAGNIVCTLSASGVRIPV